jgi:hypothetical protein
MAEVDACRDIDAVFHFGVPQLAQPERQGRCLFLPTPNAYQFLPQRIRWLCRWAIRQYWEWNYLFLIDDDTRLDVRRLRTYDTAGEDYIGPEWKPGVGYASGGGHFLSRRASAIVAERMAQTEGADDRLEGEVLREAGIKLVVDNEHFRVLAGLHDAPGPGNDWVYTTPAVRELG